MALPYYETTALLNALARIMRAPLTSVVYVTDPKPFAGPKGDYTALVECEVGAVTSDVTEVNLIAPDDAASSVIVEARTSFDLTVKITEYRGFALDMATRLRLALYLESSRLLLANAGYTLREIPTSIDTGTEDTETRVLSVATLSIGLAKGVSYTENLAQGYDYIDSAEPLDYVPET